MTDAVRDYHAHLDVCVQCERHPFEQCPIGARLLRRAVDYPFAASPLPEEPPATVQVHPEAFCGRCLRPNVWSWHAPSPLWNRVMRNSVTGEDRYSVVCPPCFAELAAPVLVGDVSWCFKPHDVDVRPLWKDGDGREWNEDRCLWVEAAGAVDEPPAGKTFEEMLDHYTVRLIEHQEPPNRHIDAKTCPWCSAAKAELLALFDRQREEIASLEQKLLKEQWEHAQLQVKPLVDAALKAAAGEVRMEPHPPGRRL